MQHTRITRKISMTASLDGFCGIDAPDQDHVDWLSLGSDITAAKYNKGEYLITGTVQLSLVLIDINSI